jgi:hypothetical protein
MKALDVLLPSNVCHVPWLMAKGFDRSVADDEFVGKWLIFANGEQIDSCWVKVRDAVAAGKFGLCAKVSTAMDTGYESKDHVICVYCADFRDKADVGRVLIGLRDVGIEGEKRKQNQKKRLLILKFPGLIKFKTDMATIAGQYNVAGPFTAQKGRSCLYYSTDFETNPV